MVKGRLASGFCSPALTWAQAADARVSCNASAAIAIFIVIFLVSPCNPRIIRDPPLDFNRFEVVYALSLIQSGDPAFLGASNLRRRLMSSVRHLRRLLATSAIGLTWAASAIAADPFTLTSTTFKDGQLMPRKVANSTSTNPICVCENVRPQLSWTGLPE